MYGQIIEFAVQSKDGVIQRVGKSFILQPKVNHQDSVNNNEDKQKKGGYKHER